MLHKMICNLLAFLLACGSLAARADEPGSGDDLESKIDRGQNLLRDAEAAAIVPGQSIESLRFRDIKGQPYYLTESLHKGPAVFVVLSTNCPLAKRYTTRIQRLNEEFSKHGVSMFAVFPNSDETRDGIEAYLAQVQFNFPAILDGSGTVVERLGATMTPQAFLIDSSSVLRYRGAIDDNRVETRVKQSFLSEAIQALLNGNEIPAASVESVGCTIHRDDLDEAPPEEVTYSRHIARILQDNCQSCHREGQVAPFSLTNFDEAKRWRAEIKEYTHARLMPPWKATVGYGDFVNDISLTQQEIDLIARWVDAGSPQGDPSELPPEPKFNDGWAYGEPDLIVEMPEEYVIGPEGEDDYRHFVIPIEHAHHRFVEAIDVRPGNRNVVHHVIAYVDTSGQARKLDAADPGPGYTRFGGVGFDAVSVIGGWAPGNLPVKAPPGSGSWLPKTCDIVLQVHYYRSGVEERDRTKIGLYFSDDPAPVPVRTNMAINTDIRLEPNNSEIEFGASRTLEQDAYLFSVTPHMHLLGEKMSVFAVRPDGSEVPLVDIQDWDFNWQTTYRLSEMIYLPAGSRVKLKAIYDNSAENPNNPHSPPQEVAWGERTTDEMCIAFFDLVLKSEYEAKLNKYGGKVAK